MCRKNSSFSYMDVRKHRMKSRLKGRVSPWSESLAYFGYNIHHEDRNKEHRSASDKLALHLPAIFSDRFVGCL